MTQDSEDIPLLQSISSHSQNKIMLSISKLLFTTTLFVFVTAGPVADINARQTVTSIYIVNATVIPPLNGVTIVNCSAGQTCVPVFIPAPIGVSIWYGT